MTSEATTDEIIRLYQPPWNLSLREIGAQVGISGQAVQRRLERAGVPRRDSAGASGLRFEAWITNEADDIAAACAETLDVDELAEKLGVPKVWIRRYFDRRFGTRAVRPQRAAHQFSHEQLLAALKAVALRHGPGPLSAHAYGRLRRSGEPSPATIADRCGGWVPACLAAGIEVDRRTQVYEPRWTRAAIVKAVERYVKACKRAGRAPKAYDYERDWRTRHEAPSVGTIRKHFGTWREAVWTAIS